MKKSTYRNTRNGNKFIEAVHYGDGHYYMIQYMKWETERGVVINYTGTRMNRKQKFRVRKATLTGILEDYELV